MNQCLENRGRLIRFRKRATGGYQVRSGCISWWETSNVGETAPMMKHGIALTSVSFQTRSKWIPRRIFGLSLMCWSARSTAGMTPRPMEPCGILDETGKKPAACRVSLPAFDLVVAAILEQSTSRKKLCVIPALLSVVRFRGETSRFRNIMTEAVVVVRRCVLSLPLPAIPCCNLFAPCLHFQRLTVWIIKCDGTRVLTFFLLTAVEQVAAKERLPSQHAAAAAEAKISSGRSDRTKWDLSS